VLGVVLLLLPLLVIGLLISAVLWVVRWLERRWLTWRFRRVHSRAGKFVVMVYSDSPHWKRHVEEQILPGLEPHAIVLNWAERSGERWQRRPLEVRVARFWGGDREFNPMAVLIPPAGAVVTIRFWQAFLELKHGKPGLLQAKQAELFQRVTEIASELTPNPALRPYGSRP
jgi:hypothetical protein